MVLRLIVASPPLIDDDCMTMAVGEGNQLIESLGRSPLACTRFNTLLACCRRNATKATVDVSIYDQVRLLKIGEVATHDLIIVVFIYDYECFWILRSDRVDQCIHIFKVSARVFNTKRFIQRIINYGRIVGVEFCNILPCLYVGSNVRLKLQCGSWIWIVTVILRPLILRRAVCNWASTGWLRIMRTAV